MATTTKNKKRSATAKPSTRARSAAAKKKAEPVDHIHAAAQENYERRKRAESVAAEPGPPDTQRLLSEDGYEPLLDLSTAKQERPHIHIDGERYELKLYREFSIGDQHTLDRDGAEFDALYSLEPPLTKKQKDRLKTLMDRLYGMVLIAPKAVAAKLDDEQRGLILTTFTVAPLQMAAQRAARLKALEDESETTPEPETPDT